MIPLPFLSAVGGSKLELELNDISQMGPGYFPGLDVICEGVLKGESFVYPAEHQR